MADISHLQLTDYLSDVDLPINSALFLNRFNQVVLLNVATGQPVETSMEVLAEEYFPHVPRRADAAECFSSDGHYLKGIERHGKSSELMIWDLLQQKKVFSRNFSKNFNCFFQSSHELVYFNEEDHSLYYYDLEKGGSPTRLLNSSYFENNPAFPNLPFAFWYHEKLHAYLFFVEGEPVGDQEYTFKIVFTDFDGTVLAQSDSIPAPLDSYSMDFYATDDVLLIMLSVPDPKQVSDDEIITYIYQACFYLDDTGRLVFEE